METKNYSYRADVPAWIFIGGLSAFPWLILWANSASHGIDIIDLLIPVCTSLFSFAWLASFRIIITPTELIFRSLFHGKKVLPHAEITKVRLTWKFWQTRGPLRLVVESRGGKTAPLEINAKVFSRKAVEAVLDLGSRVAEVDDDGLREGIVLKSWRDWRKRSRND